MRRPYNPGMRRALPTFVAPPPPMAPDRVRRERLGLAVVVGLALLLVLQIVLADRDALAASARWRPLVAGACALLRCEVPAWREPAALTLVRRDVQPLPGHPGVLHVSAQVRNDAVWPQAWPVLVLTLSRLANTWPTRQRSRHCAAASRRTSRWISASRPRGSWPSPSISVERGGALDSFPRRRQPKRCSSQRCL